MAATAKSTASTCRFCGAFGVQTVDSRPGMHPGWRRRRRVCIACGERWSSMEVPLEDIDKMLHITRKLREVASTAQVLATDIAALEIMADARSAGGDGEVLPQPKRPEPLVRELTIQEMGAVGE